MAIDVEEQRARNAIEWWRYRRAAITIFLALVAMAATCFFMPFEMGVATWLIVLLLLVLSSVVIGYTVSGVWWGILVDTRNMVSLSRLQLVAWTILVLSALLTAALTNVSWAIYGQAHALVDPLAIALPEELWALMGISTASFAGATLIKGNKAQNPATPTLNFRGRVQLEATRGAQPGQTTAIVGRLVANNSVVSSSAGDIFRGEEIGNADHVDLGKVQMFYFTAIVVVAYGFALASMFAGGVGRITEFPDLSSSMLTLLGISHAGYLTIKGASHTGQGPA